jgi:hypothetical protein
MTELCAVQAGDVAAQLPPRWSAHPTFPSLRRTTAQAIRQDANQLLFTLRYQGIIQGLEPTVPEKHFFRTIADEPIDTHKDFVTTLGGTAGAPLHKAQFDREGRFAFFRFDPANDDPETDLRAVQTYKHASFGLKLIYARLAPPAKVTQPRILYDVPYAPILEDGYSYLELPPYWDQVGGYYRVTYEYLASGPRGWNTLVYPVAGA